MAHFLDGRVLKGSSFDISPSRPVCHLATRDQGTVAVKLGDLKALFFVKDLQGNPEHHDEQVPASGDPRARGARWLEIRFQEASASSDWPRCTTRPASSSLSCRPT